MNSNRVKCLRLILFASILAQCGCATTAYVLTGSSVTSGAHAAADLQDKLHAAEALRCKPLGIGVGSGIGFSADECPESETIEDQTVFTVQVLVECPRQADLSELTRVGRSE